MQNAYEQIISLYMAGWNDRRIADKLNLHIEDVMDAIDSFAGMEIA